MTLYSSFRSRPPITASKSSILLALDEDIDSLPITELEYVQLKQLQDRDHELSVGRLNGFVLLDVPCNQWAFDELEDWRVRHPPNCECAKLLKNQVN